MNLHVISVDTQSHGLSRDARRHGGSIGTPVEREGRAGSGCGAGEAAAWYLWWSHGTGSGGILEESTGVHGTGGGMRNTGDPNVVLVLVQ